MLKGCLQIVDTLIDGIDDPMDNIEIYEKDKENKIVQEDSGSDQNNQPEDVDINEVMFRPVKQLL